ncbi:MAG: hypothetical protein KAU31_01765 [Spirochaetaceae bacterium]|nr:hypothetical protein [Spirochaetaceae bacterium]
MGRGRTLNGLKSTAFQQCGVRVLQVEIGNGVEGAVARIGEVWPVHTLNAMRCTRGVAPALQEFVAIPAAPEDVWRKRLIEETQQIHRHPG